MNKSKAKRIIPAVLGTAGLAVPACAAVCPKGIGECPYPGRCFLYVDSDGDSLCDYLSSGSSPAAADTDPVTVSNSAADSVSDSYSGRHRGGSAVDTLQSAATPLSSSGGTDVSGDPGLNPILLTAAGLVIAGAAILSAYFILRYIKKENPLLHSRIFIYAGFVPVLLAVLIMLNDPESFGFSGTAADLAARYSGIVYMFGGTFLMTGMWLKNAVSKYAAFSVLVLTVAAGFLLVIPIAPDGFYAFVSGLTTLRIAGLGVAGFFLLACISLIFGRVFCAHMCPAGALQEILSKIPAPKIRIGDRRIPGFTRIAVFVLIVGGVAVSFNIFEYIGVSHLFALIFSTALIVFLAILVLSLFVYRPFCTFMCPYGLLMSVFARFGRFGLKRTEKCIGCGRCERVCPTKEAGGAALKSECYLCGRCMESCPVEGAIIYGRRRSGIWPS